MKIVLGIDDSAHSEAALEFVRKMAWPKSTRVVVVSSVPLPVATLTSLVPVTGIEMGVLVRELTNIHGQWAKRGERMLREAGLEAEARVMQGDPREILLEISKKEYADLLVVGSHGRSSLPELRLGSVTSHLVSHAPCSVLVVKPASEKTDSGAS
jgi:nucleotide-binding universal stress UspA family protein